MAERAKIWVRVQVDPGPRLVTAASEDVRFLEQPIPFSRKIEDPPEPEPEPEAREQAAEIRDELSCTSCAWS
ncbi:hypothetical protein ENSA5_00250 [Enhygromyxa salina]|uniref:Uncharacterized protein n=1 Tax=Enhygromyxa salina TaxID=215803 RepID=A0A2S9YLD4_9BACT|nr:hypothetical protein [Enhygromyxa salina]PRQ05913.1 hypothetical protein ENSA5_00250 [Enhygromyxa salina]